MTAGGSDKEKRVLFLGDSLTRATFRNKGDYAYLGFARRLESERNDVMVEGVDGITTAAWLDRYPQRGLKPHVAFVMLGTNDAWQKVPVDQVVQNLTRLKEMIGCRVVVLTPPPTREEETNVLIRQYAEVITTTFPKEHLDLSGLPIPHDGFFPDGVHLFTKGHDLIYEVVKAKLEEILAEPVTE